MSTKIDKPKAYAWVAYMFTHQPDEIKHLLKYGTPSERFIKLAEQPVGMTLADGRFRLINFPESLNKAKGQKFLYEAAQRINIYIKTMPAQAFDLLQDIKTNVTHRRKDTQSNYHMVAEAVCHRAASEFKHEVLFAFDSIITWVKSAYGKDLGYLTIRRALEAIEAAGYFKIREWGIRGNRSKCTKIELRCSPEEYILTYTSKVDDWMLFLDHAMTKVYARESTTRQDVLEERIHHFADQVADDSAYARGTRLFPVSDDTIVAEVPTIESKEDLHDTYIDRFLGRLVQSLQEDGSDSGQGNRRIPESSNTS